MGKDAGDLYIKCFSINEIFSETMYLEDCHWILKLDGSESKRQISGSTSISNGVMSGGSSYITSKLIPLNKDWELSFDYMFGGHGCAVQLVKNGITSRDTQCLKLQNAYARKEIYYKGVSTAQAWQYDNSISYNTWYSARIVKEGTAVTVYANNEINEVTSSVWDVLNLTSDNLGIGVDTWSSTAYIKNVRLKLL